jgi:DHA1 family multidrug resistance protein-like MFS transporter
MPQTPFQIPVIGTAVHVWGNAMIVFSLVPYLFDAFPPAATLSALTVAAVGRILLAGALPLVILQDFAGLGGNWALSLFGFVSIALWPVSFVLFRYGKIWRERGRLVRIDQSMS